MNKVDTCLPFSITTKIHEILQYSIKQGTNRFRKNFCCPFFGGKLSPVSYEFFALLNEKNILNIKLVFVKGLPTVSRKKINSYELLKQN